MIKMKFFIVALLFLSIGQIFNLSAQVAEQDSLALIALFDSTDGVNWTNNDNWLTGPVSTWRGITVSEGRVTEIALIDNNLTGTIPPEIGNLTGTLRLMLHRNKLTGNIPAEIGNLVNLTFLNLLNNQLAGDIPSEIWNLVNLEKVYLSQNQFTGTLPPEIGNLSKLTFITLWSNQLTGNLPDEIYNLTNLTDLDFSQNQFEGPISPSIGQLVNLEFLSLGYNNFSGNIPVEIGNLNNLTKLYLASNQLTDFIPHEIGNLTNLIELTLYDNQLDGPIPEEIGNLNKLTYLNITDNQLSGTVPTQIGNLIEMTDFRIYNNQFSDTLPHEFGNMTHLKWLYVHRNQFSGPIPTEIASLPELERFHLYDNQFTDLPDLTADTSLTELIIQNNKFTFEDIEPNIGIPGFVYSPQDSVGEEQDTTINQNSFLEISVNVGGTANEYQWKKDGIDIPGANNNSFTIDSAQISDAGEYICKITNTTVTGLTLYCRPIHVTVKEASGIVSSITQLPEKFILYQNYPNPFNSTTVLKYDLPKSTWVVLKVYNLSGQSIKTLVDDLQNAGRKSISWDGRDHLGLEVASGIYIYRIETDSFIKSGKMLLIK
ncbi:T9SS type A sorting domain-containing protein [candidate division KSB1 bacterium]|nr:T9SS type A sorting domain-containing protein [candidate division KSB1 bacterium]